jgi:hypothetical protein
MTLEHVVTGEQYKYQSCYTLRYFNAFPEVRLLYEPKNLKTNMCTQLDFGIIRCKSTVCPQSPFEVL